MPHSSPNIEDRLPGLDFNTGEILGYSNQGEVRRVRLGERDLAIKTPKGRGLSWRLGQATLRREHRAYQRVAGLSGFAPCHGLLDDRYLVLDYVDGASFRNAALDNRERFFDQLLTVIDAMHAAGVAHGDLKRKDNLRVDAEQRPVILDLGAAVLRRDGFHPVNRRLFEFIRQTDLNAWIKLKYEGYDNVSEVDLKRLRRSALERLLSRLRRR
jgi:tRNA A-37 threonylcarbamoyl transferase component Bud32